MLQTRNPAVELERDWLAGSRQFGWNFLGAFLARAVSQIRPDGPDAAPLDEAGAAIELGFYRRRRAMRSRSGRFRGRTG